MANYYLSPNASEINNILQKANNENKITGVSPFEVRTQATAYTKGAMVTNGGKTWVLKSSTFYGAWSSSDWEESDLCNELMKLRGTDAVTESLTINVSVNRGAGVVAGQNVVIAFTASSISTTVTKQVGADGKITMLIPKGDQYQIQPAALSGYTVRNSQIYTASLATRVVDIVYEQVGTGVYIIDNMGVATDVALWDTANNANAWGVKFTNSNLVDVPVVFPKNSVAMQASFCAEYEDFTTITNRGNASAAEADFMGKAEADAWYTEATTPNAEEKTYVDIYNETHSPAITIDDYLPAIMTCRNKTVSFMGGTLHGYLPSMGQLRAMCDNRDLLSAAMSKIGGNTFPNLASGGWWSCSEYYYNVCWILYGGTTGNGYKYISYQLFALYDLSENNL